MYKNFAYDSNIFLVSYGEYKNDNPVKQQLSSIEFEYWVVNEHVYETLWTYAFISFLVFGLFLCSLMLMVYKSGISE
jgi:cytochrome c biogenesis protein ResB